jgi:sigma-B regulation protein RsbU (phosphoserine phosphatase)
MFLALAAQSQAAVPHGLESATQATVAPAGIHSILELDGPWRFQIGDNPQWADPGFDDSAWSTVTLGKALSEQGIDTYSGYAWYRLRLQPSQLPDHDSSSPLELLVSGRSVGQLAVYINGRESGRTRGMTDKPQLYQSPPFRVLLARDPKDGTLLLAIRSWGAFGTPIRYGLLDKVELGTPNDVVDRLALATARHWDQQVVAAMAVAFLYLCVAALGLILYFAQRNHPEYLWLALLCLSAILSGAAEISFGLALVPYPLFLQIIHWQEPIFIAVTLEFILRFTATTELRNYRIFQASVFVLPIISLAGLPQLYSYLSIGVGLFFSVLVWVLLFRAWRRGLREAGIMLLPFFLSATADSIDSLLRYAASRHWIPEQSASPRFHLGPIESNMGLVIYSLFLTSLMAVILYRFVRISQEEQRSTAEIAAARSVQALLIPTQLPSNRHFMLESAYLPANGVGGDFFQVLPVNDDSMLIVVGDVSGKGLQAAMNASTLVGALRNELSHDPGTILNHLNQVMLGATRSADSNAVASFATCLCARVFPDGQMTIANAGHLSPYRDGREMELSPGLPLGVISGIHYEQTDFHLNQGDRLIFISDGVVEATNSDGELFGFERTQQVSHEPAKYIAQTARHFGQTDDITVVSLYFVSRVKTPVSKDVVSVG